MFDLKIHHILTLSHLLSIGARYNFVSVTTSEIGKNIKKSQQAASRHLLDLEQGMFIERLGSGREMSVRITPRGYEEIAKLHAALQKGMDSSPPYVWLKGTVVSGMGEGAYYMALQGYARQFESRIGYVPFPGTLNVRLGMRDREAARQFGMLDGTIIDGFADGKRTYGWVKCFEARLNDSVDCHMTVLERTHHGDSIMELISDACIREKAGLKDGSRVAVRVTVHP